MKQKELEELLENLTLDEKIGQLVQLNGSFFDSNEEIVTGPVAKIGINKDKIYQTGSILNTSGAKELKQLQKRYLDNNQKKIPMLFMADIINGFKTIFPISLGLGCSFNPQIVKKTAEVAAKEAAVSGIHITFSPMVDMVRDARWGRVMESYGEDTYLNCQYSKAMVEGYQGDNDPHSNIASCVKHFAGYGAPVAGREYNTVELSKRTFLQDYLPAYQAAVDAGCKLVMSSFNTIDGVPVTGNKWLLRDVLRNQWNFDGVVISDHSAVKELIMHGVAANAKDAAKQALEAGCDIDMMTATYSNNLKDLVEKGEIDEALIDEACMRVLQLKNDLGLFENPYRGADEEEEKKYVMCDEFKKIARDVVSKTLVLLKNDQHVLPLARTQKIALVGPYSMSKKLCGIWSFNADYDLVVSVSEGMTEYSDNLTCAKGSTILDDYDAFDVFFGQPDSDGLKRENKEKLLNEAINVAQESDVIVVAIGEDPQQSGEGGARGTLTLSQVQLNLLKEMRKLNKPIVTLVFSGRPLELKEVAKNSDALLQCWFPGSEGGHGIADVLFGKVNPSARLSMTFPYSVGQCPIYYNQYSTGRPVLKSTHSKRFTSRYTDIPVEPSYCFGYGLTYSHFIYSDVTLNQNTLTLAQPIFASITLKNDSEVAGEETVQMYIRDLVGSVVRPVKELKAVQKVTLKPHESKVVTFEINEDMLKFYRYDYSYDSEAGDFEVYIGPNSSTKNKHQFTLVK